MHGPEHPEGQEEPDESSVAGLLRLVRSQRDLLVAVATGGPAFDSVAEEYEVRRRRIRAGLARLGLEDPFPWRTLWEWHRHYPFFRVHRPAHVGAAHDVVMQRPDRLPGLRAHARRVRLVGIQPALQPRGRG